MKANTEPDLKEIDPQADYLHLLAEVALPVQPDATAYFDLYQAAVGGLAVLLLIERAGKTGSRTVVDAAEEIILFLAHRMKKDTALPPVCCRDVSGKWLRLLHIQQKFVQSGVPSPFMLKRLLALCEAV